jgi:hypothetical protein
VNLAFTIVGEASGDDVVAKVIRNDGAEAMTVATTLAPHEET